MPKKKKKKQKLYHTFKVFSSGLFFALTTYKIVYLLCYSDFKMLFSESKQRADFEAAFFCLKTAETMRRKAGCISKQYKICKQCDLFREPYIIRLQYISVI